MACLHTPLSSEISLKYSSGIDVCSVDIRALNTYSIALQEFHVTQQVHIGRVSINQLWQCYSPVRVMHGLTFFWGKSLHPAVVERMRFQPYIP